MSPKIHFNFKKYYVLCNNIKINEKTSREIAEVDCKECLNLYKSLGFDMREEN